MTNALSRVSSGGGTSRTLCNTEETNDTVRQLNSGNLESLAASVKEDFSRLNRSGGLDLVPAAQVDFFISQDFFIG